MRIGVVDVGSSAVKYAVYETGETPVLVREGDPVATSLGRGLRAGAPLDPVARRRTRENVRAFVAAMRALDARPALLLATEAVRRTCDRETFLDELRADMGGDADVRCIGFEEEARWAFDSARATLGPFDREVLVVDPGGSSNDYALGDQNGATRLFSLAFGMNDFMDVADPRADEGRIDEAAAAALSAAGRERYAALRTELDSMPSRLIAGSGAAIALAAVKLGLDAPDRETRARKGHGAVVTREDLGRFAADFAPLSAARRREIHPCISASRAPIFVHGALVYDAMLEVLGLDEMTVNGFGIKLGAVLSLA